MNDENARLIGRTLKASTKSIEVYEDALIFSYRAIYHGFKGKKRIPLSSIVSVKFREPKGLFAGYIQFIVQGDPKRDGPANLDDNSAQYDRKNFNDFEALRDFVSERIGLKSHPKSLADELEKLAYLKESGALSDDEFCAAKAILLKSP